ncbi:L,D-transpeptidase [Legionella micdadei]|uniref:Enhanced entry protein EnhA (Modular protein) n=1 Tax=Legionella micdadei TaxID=451 RepID=A0A098GGC4_LEGMI|nr:L,D-transpeptidase [Legionella micdadei]ARG97476.1 L,D-transpeptidase [Legionella micdadei]ARH00214.1 L,D-transpeptidase [Legionella micdadei]KTD28373.1 enhanced entry protein EnhA [Legionella micdadei]CEG61035.1 Enhanced entry protein EnhA (modular protein) [Legionella micdadei]SCY70831.1 L,D-transpeptidase catalytic domain [Legionella micdadei]
MERIRPRKLLYFAVGFSFFFSISEHTAFAASSDFSSPKMVLASNTFIFNPRTLTWKAVKDGKVIRSGKAIGGSKYCRDIGRSCRTPTGTYSILSKGGPGCRSSRYPVGKGGAKMPYCMFFTTNYAVHGSYEMPNYNASHGCIRVYPDAARWLNHNFLNIGSTVIVKPY